MITVLELAKHRNPELANKDEVSMGDIEDTGLPFMGGCEICYATIACYNAYPTKTGYLRCKDDVEGYAFETVEEANKFIFGDGDGTSM